MLFQRTEAVFIDSGESRYQEHDDYNASMLVNAEDITRCGRFGSILIAGIMELNGYTVHVTCFQCKGCQDWFSTLRLHHQIIFRALEYCLQYIRSEELTCDDVKSALEDAMDEILHTGKSTCDIYSQLNKMMGEIIVNFPKNDERLEMADSIKDEISEMDCESMEGSDMADSDEGISDNDDDVWGSTVMSMFDLEAVEVDGDEDVDSALASDSDDNLGEDDLF